MTVHQDLILFETIWIVIVITNYVKENVQLTQYLSNPRITYLDTYSNNKIKLSNLRLLGCHIFLYLKTIHICFLCLVSLIWGNFEIYYKLH